MLEHPGNCRPPWVTMRKIIHVDTAGTYTFYVTGMEDGTGNSR
jgi:hypothetical protein